MADPTIPLQLNFQQPSSGLDQATKLFQLNQLMNQNRLFQLELAGRQRLGQIFSQNVDENGNPLTDVAIGKALADPIAGPFAIQQLGGYRQAQQAEQAMQVQRSEVMGKAWGDLQKRLAIGAAQPNVDTNLLGSIVKEWGAQYPDWAQKQLGAPAADFLKSLISTPDGSAPTQALLRQRLQMFAPGALSKEEYGNTFGEPTVQPMAGPNGINQPTAGVTPPAATGGGFTPAGSQNTLAGIPQGMTPEAAQTPVVTPSGKMERSGTALPPVVSSGTPAAPGPAGAAPGIASPVQQGYLEARGKELGDYQKSLDNNVTTMAQMMTTVQEAKKAMETFKPGGGAEMYAKAAQFLQAIGAPKAIVDKVANGSLAGSQEFNKLMVDTTMSRIRASLMGIGGSRINQQEFEKFEANNPNIDVDPRAIEKIFNFWNHVYQMSKDEQSTFREHIKGGGDIQDWPTKWQDTLQNKYGIGEAEATSATSGMTTRQAPAIPTAAIQQLKEGKNTKFSNGQTWTLRNGEPVQVQ